MASSVKVEIKDDQTLLNKILALDGTDIEVAVGLFSESDKESTMKGILNERGTSRAPARPFVEPTYTANEKGMVKRIKSELRKDTNPNIFMMELANEMVDRIKNRIDSGKFKKLSPITIAKKGHAMPLKDTMEMYNAIKSRRLK